MFARLNDPTIAAWLWLNPYYRERPRIRGVILDDWYFALLEAWSWMIRLQTRNSRVAYNHCQRYSGLETSNDTDTDDEHEPIKRPRNQASN